MNIKDKTLKQAINILNGLGLKYAIIDFDGNTLGELTVVMKKVQRLNNFKQTGYIEVIEKMEVGEIQEFTPPENTTPEAFRKAIAGRMCGLHGKGSGSSCIQDGKVQIMRIL